MECSSGHLPGSSVWSPQPEENHDESEDIQTRVKSKGTGGLSARDHAMERDRQYGSIETVVATAPRHADFPMAEWENLCGVGEWSRPLSG